MDDAEEHYDEPGLTNLRKAFENAWASLQAEGLSQSEEEDLKLQLQQRLLALSAEGLNDPEQLERLALASITRFQDSPALLWRRLFLGWLGG
jgi:hypothetical protein